MRPSIYFSRKIGFTMVEIIMGAGIMAMLLSGILLVFRSGSKSMELGTWRLDSQKKAQVLMGNLRELVENANYVSRMFATGEIASDPLPILINKRYKEKWGSCSDVNEPVMSFSVATPYLAPIPELGRTTATMGSWSGVMLYCGKKSASEKNKNRVITLIRTGNKDDFALWKGTVPNPTFSSYYTSNNLKNLSIELNDVASLSVKTLIPSDVKEASSIEITLTLVRYEGDRPTATSLTEKTVANLSNKGIEIKEFSP
ncbi:MAG: hypothetical protein HQM10_09710 [Candidatus Riflebacteria bacterium]|nr:hypothetical protein [Candidatus Riflebacteria bacterium]